MHAPSAGGAKRATPATSTSRAGLAPARGRGVDQVDLRVRERAPAVVADLQAHALAGTGEGAHVLEARELLVGFRRGAALVGLRHVVGVHEAQRHPARVVHRARVRPASPRVRRRLHLARVGPVPVVGEAPKGQVDTHARDGPAGLVDDEPADGPRRMDGNAQRRRALQPASSAVPAVLHGCAAFVFRHDAEALDAGGLEGHHPGAGRVRAAGPLRAGSVAGLDRRPQRDVRQGSARHAVEDAQVRTARSAGSRSLRRRAGRGLSARCARHASACGAGDVDELRGSRGGPFPRRSGGDLGLASQGAGAQPCGATEGDGTDGAGDPRRARSRRVAQSGRPRGRGGPVLPTGAHRGAGATHERPEGPEREALREHVAQEAQAAVQLRAHRALGPAQLRRDLASALAFVQVQRQHLAVAGAAGCGAPPRRPRGSRPPRPNRAGRARASTPSRTRWSSAGSCAGRRRPC